MDHKVVPIYSRGNFRLMAEISKLVILRDGKQVDCYNAQEIDEAIQTVDDMAESLKVA